MKPVAVLHHLAEKKLGEPIALPADVFNARKYYEGVIACAEANGNKRLVHVGLKKGSAYHQSWESGWALGEQKLAKKQIRYLDHRTHTEFKFQKVVGYE